MANWCSNKVVFEGTPEAITAIQELFQSMKGKEERTEQGQLPDFIPDNNGGYFFNLYWNEGDEGHFQYETKWSPNIEIVQKIAEHYKVNFKKQQLAFFGAKDLKAKKTFPLCGNCLFLSTQFVAHVMGKPSRRFAWRLALKCPAADPHGRPLLSVTAGELEAQSPFIAEAV